MEDDRGDLSGARWGGCELKRDFWLKLEFAVIAALVLLGLASAFAFAWSAFTAQF